MLTLPLRNTAPGVWLEANPVPQRWKGAMGEVVPIATFPWTAKPLFKSEPSVPKPKLEPIPTDPNTPKVVPGADPPIPNLINPLFQKKGFTPVMDEEESQKAIWPLAVEEPDTPDPPASA